MKVMKFGGSSVGTPDSIKKVKRIVEQAGDDVIVVVSALGGVTDKLLSISKTAAQGDASYKAALSDICLKHTLMVEQVIPQSSAREQLQIKVQAMLSELQNIFQGIYLIKDLSPKTSNTIVSYGERLSSTICAELCGAQWFDFVSSSRRRKSKGRISWIQN